MGLFKLDLVKTTEMKADGFTKLLSREKHALFVKQLNLQLLEDTWPEES